MGIEIPDAVKWLTPIVVGASWPEGDETALRRVADAWEQAAKAVGEAIESGGAAAGAALGCMTGDTADAFDQYWQKFVGGEAYLPTLEQLCNDLAAGCDSTALNIEYTKLSIIAALIILAAQIAAMIASAVATFGTSTAGIPIAQAATRITVQMIFRELVKQILINVAINVGVDAAIQGLQFAKGDRQTWDLDKTISAAKSGAAAGIAGGLVGAGSGALGGVTGNFGQAAARGAAEGFIAGAAGNALSEAFHGRAPTLEGMTAGGVSGTPGGALGGMGNRHAGLDATWGTGSGDGYTAGHNTQGHTFTTPDGATVRANIPGNPYSGGWSSGNAQHIPGSGGPNMINPQDTGYQGTSNNPPRMVGNLDLPDPE